MNKKQNKTENNLQQKPLRSQLIQFLFLNVHGVKKRLASGG
jgi:hypothetical protein